MTSTYVGCGTYTRSVKQYPQITQIPRISNRNKELVYYLTTDLKVRPFICAICGYFSSTREQQLPPGIPRRSELYRQWHDCFPTRVVQGLGVARLAQFHPARQTLCKLDHSKDGNARQLALEGRETQM